MRIPSGATDRILYFVGIDSSDHTSRKTGLSSFTVYRSRDGGSATAYTTPTVTEVDATNMPGLYKFVIDEDTTLSGTHGSEEYVVHITATGMDPVTRSLEIYGIAAESILTAGANKLADFFLRRTYANGHASANGDTLNFRSLLGAIASLVNKRSITSNTLTVTHEDDTTAFNTLAVTRTVGADPITAVDPT